MTTDVADKWGKEIAGRGFAQVPNYLLLLNQFLDPDRRLSPLDMMILIQLVGAWWKKEELPFPSLPTLATRCGVSDRQIQRSINNLVKRDLIERTKRRNDKGVKTNNAYSLAPLIVMLNDVAKAFPNGYPRQTDRVKMREISKRLSVPPPEASELVQEEAPA